ncbi:flippase activity-associated protein Agl23 [Halobellus sp. GM3]|uniref:flippase activity-associated protein Agl23 n=1 Tax=Halobellus sp. GM3 TaxID=3458410 RepID=UPI00403DB67F
MSRESDDGSVSPHRGDARKRTPQRRSAESTHRSRPLGEASARLGRALVPDRVTAAVLAIALAGAGLRLFGLGSRPFHWDEARVGYWALRYLDTGAFQYRPVAGGPLLYLLDRALFSLLGVSEFIARLPVALLGAALPLVSLLFRDRLDDAETVLFAAALAVQPLVLYYSRFLRGDVPLALFGLAFVGFALRSWDRRSRRDAYAAAVVLPLAASASGFVVGYLVCWLAAWVLVIEQRRVAAGDTAAVRRTAASLRDRLSGQATPAARAGLLATAATVFLFAPRSGPGVDVGLYDPTKLYLAIYEGTVGALGRFIGVRVVDRFPDGTHAILPYVSDAASLLLALAAPVVVFGVAATLRARYAAKRRPLVEGVGYWGLLAAAVFPTIAEVSAPWTLVHVVAPLSLPAAVGLVALLRWGATTAGDATGPNDARPGAALGAESGGAGVRATIDAGTVVAVVLVILAIAAQGGAVAAGVYAPADRDTELAQFAQPSDDLEPFAAAVRAAADVDSETVEVLYVGSTYHVPEGRDTGSPPSSDAWGNRLPLPWYVEAAGADATSAENVSVVEAAGDAPAPPVVVSEPRHRDALVTRLGPEYRAATYRLGLWNREVVVFTRSAGVATGASGTDPAVDALASRRPRPSAVTQSITARQVTSPV